MSKLLDTALHATPQTQCPGTTSYMAPEALRTPPVYSKKLDCFSFGVLCIQIMTRQFPDPGPAKQVVEDPRSPVGTMEMPVLERERRKKHIDIVAPNHPLLPTTLRCLEYHERNRPSAQELCDQLATLKEGPPYTQSVTREEGRGRNDATAEIAAKNDQIQELQRNLAAHIKDVENMQRSMTARDRDVEDLQQQLQNERGLKADFQQKLLQKEGENRDLREIVRVLQEQPQLIPKQEWSAAKCMPDVKALKWEQKHTSPKHLIGLGTATAVDGSTVYACRSGEVYAYAPLYYSTGTTLCGQLLAIGGRKDNDQDSNSVHKYNPAKNNWSIISQMPEAESFPLVEVLPGNTLLVLNRRNVYTASVVQE